MPTSASTRLGLIGPLGTDQVANGDDIIRAIIAQLEAVGAAFEQGTSRPTATAALQGYFYVDTGTPLVSYCTGSVWLDFQPYDSDLAAIAALSTTTFGRSVLTQVDAAALRTLAGLGTAATQASSAFDAAGAAAAAQAASQPLDSDLTAIAALASAANKLPYATGAGAWALADLTAAGRALIDDADATAQRATLGLGSAAVLASSALPGYEIGYDQITAPVTITATSGATANTVITCAAHTFDGAPVIAKFSAPYIAGANNSLYVVLWEGATQLGQLCANQASSAVGGSGGPGAGELRFSPSAGSHSYLIKAWVSAGSGGVGAGTNAAGDYVPAFVRFTKV